MQLLRHSLTSLLALLFVFTCAVVAIEASQIPLEDSPAAAHPVYTSMSPPAPTAAVADEEASDEDETCLSASDAHVIGRDFGLLISNYTTKLAVQLLADEFIDQADSVNTLINSSPLPNQPLGSLTFDSKQAFLDGQGAQPPVPFDILRIYHTCNAVIIRWRSHQKPDQVQGVSIGEARPATADEIASGLGVGGEDGGEERWLLKAVYAEFNSGAWLKNLGSPECEGSKHKGWEVET